MITINDLRSHYLFPDNAPDVFKGRRSHLRYVSPYYYRGFTNLNPNGPEPFDYLEYAKADIVSQTQRGALNSLGNTKRAIHLTIDNFLRIFGLDKSYLKTSFPTKLEIIKLVNAFPTRMINHLNHERNLVEHEFLDTDMNIASDFLDVAEMFLMMMYPYLRHATIGAFVGIEGDDRCFDWSIQVDEAKIQISEVSSKDFIYSQFGKIHLDFSARPEDLKLIESINIARTNVDKWINYLDFFVYCTKRNALRQPNIKMENDHREESETFKLLVDAFNATKRNSNES